MNELIDLLFIKYIYIKKKKVLLLMNKKKEGTNKYKNKIWVNRWI